jgi:DNA-binding NarL/FixJ family response regulator
MRAVVAAKSREVKAALFVAMSGREDIEIVASATSAAETVTFCRAFRPDILILEAKLPGRPLAEVIAGVAEPMQDGRIFVLGTAPIAEVPSGVEVLGLDQIDDLARPVDGSPPKLG